jgi:hypothetical protein
MSSGIVVESGPPDQIFNGAQHADTRELLSHSDM